MGLISFSNVSKMYDSELILDHISFSINLKEKVALIGNNGSGKTTIFKLILKIIEPTLMPKEDKCGDINIISNLKIGYLDQNALTNLENTVYDELLEPFKELIQLEKNIEEIGNKLKDVQDESLCKKYDEMLHKFISLDGYHYKNKIDEFLFRFGFSTEYKNKIVKTLSGGERMKIAFIKILLSKCDILLLDEPTNHLDISTIDRLENYLKKYNGTILFISHDRFFLESLATKVLDLENKKIVTYNMDYNHYLEEKKSHYEYLLKEAKIQEKEIEKIKKFIEFYKPKPRFVSRAKDREKKLAKLEKNKIEIPKNNEKKINFKLEGSNLKNKQLFKFENLLIGYSEPLVPAFSFDIYGKDKIAICGDNGVGKTTLIKTIAKIIEPLDGKIKEYRNVSIGYIKQNDYIFEQNETALSYLKSNYPLKSNEELRKALGQFYFKGEDVFKYTQLMSNGEKMRLTLCSLALKGYDLLLLDEPTNHLDMVTKESLIMALKNYEGAIVFISHDRYFINELANITIYLSKNNVFVIDGNYNNLKSLLDLINDKKELNKIDEIEKKINEKPKKLSNNKLNELNHELENMEKRILEIEELLEGDFESYNLIDELEDEKDKLEHRYLEIIDIIEKDKKVS